MTKLLSRVFLYIILYSFSPQRQLSPAEPSFPQRQQLYNTLFSSHILLTSFRTCEWVESVDLVVAWPAFRSHYENSPLFPVVEGTQGIGTCFNAAGKAAIATIQNSGARPTISGLGSGNARDVNSF